MRSTWRSVNLAWPVLPVAVLTVVTARPALAYIDPGTGSAFFGSLLPVLGIIGVFFVATLGFARTYVRRAFSFLWRHRLWVGVALAVIAAIVVAAVLLGGGGATTALSLDGWMGVAEARSVDRRVPQVADRRVPQGRAREQFAARYGGKRLRGEGFRLFGSREFPGVERCKYDLNDACRNAFLFERSGAVETEVTPPPGAKLLFAVGADPPGKAQLTVTAQPANADAAATLFEESWPVRGLRRWRTVSVPLDDYTGEPVTLRFEVRFPEGSGDGPVFLLGEPRLAAPPTMRRTNVILLSIETLRADHLSLYGYAQKTSPFLEELAQESVVFDHAYAQSSWTRPSVASMLTGLLPSEHGAVSALDKLGDALTTLPEVLRERDFATAAFLTSPVVCTPVFNYHQGFDLFVNEGVAPVERVRGDVVGWLDQERTEPFFLFVHTYDPHAPYDAPGDYRERFAPDYDGPVAQWEALVPHELRGATLSARDMDYVLARYDAEIRYTDDVLRKLAADLKERDLWDGTLLIVTSDHGEAFDEHRDWGHGGNLFPEKIHIPLLVKLPGGRHGGTRVGAPAGHVDLMPTVLDLLGVGTPGDTSGVSLRAACEGADGTGRDYHVAEFWNPVYRQGNPVRCEITAAWHSVVGERYQYVRHQRLVNEPPPARQMLFDLEADPGADHNVAADHPEVFDEYARVISQRYGHAGYTVAVNGTGDPRTVRGFIECDGQIESARGERTEDDDGFVVAEDRTSLRFELNVTSDDDLLRFRTRPANAAIRLHVEGRREPVLLGARRVRAGAMPVVIPSAESAADTRFGEAVKYSVGTGGGVHVWRQGVSHLRQDDGADPDEETLQQLKDLGYL